MSKRGFDESQLRKTIVTMIDKDGFNKRTVVEGPASIGGGLPTPTRDGNALISLNGEWIQQPGYGYSTTEVVETLCEFTSEDFEPSQFDEGNMYVASITVDQEMLEHFMILFGSTPFNVQIDDKIYNSEKDNFVFNATPPIIYLLDPNSEENLPIFALRFIDEEMTNFGFFVTGIPTHAKIYREETNSTGIDSNLVKCAPFYVDLDDTRQDQSNPSYESKVTFAELDDAVKRNAPIFIRFNAYYADEQSNDPIIDTIIMPALVRSETVPNASTGPSIQTYMLTSLFPSSFNLHGVDANSDFEIYLEFQKDNEFVLIQMYKRERTTRTSVFTNQV